MKFKILNMLENADGYLSGEYISKQLNISRNSVWKLINKLRDEGYVITSVTNRGYKFESRFDAYSAEEIKRQLNTDFIAKNIYFTDCVNSTNTWAKENNDCPDGSVFVAVNQSCGKGRRGRNWISDDKGIWFSVLLKPDILPADVSVITLVAGLAVRSVIGDTATIKWPNDIILSSKKVCGILTEMSCEMLTVNYIVCGIGINVNTDAFPEEISDIATSVMIEQGKKVNKAAFLSAVLNSFEKYYKIFLENGFKALSGEYKDNCITIGKTVKINENGREYIAMAVGVSDNGDLIIEENGITKQVFSGEVSVRGILDYI